jgi:transitional endoplasmic reticulum ATPase
MRAGRFDYVLELALPDAAERLEILEIITQGLPLDADVSLPRLAERAKGWSGADLDVACKKAAILGLEEYRLGKAESFRVAARQLDEAWAQVAKTASTARPKRPSARREVRRPRKPA